MKRNEECYKFVNIRAPVELSTRLVLEILHKQKSGQQISQKDFEKSLLWARFLSHGWYLLDGKSWDFKKEFYPVAV